VSAERLSPLDASFLAVETDASPMHVGWVAGFDPPEQGPRPAVDELLAHVSGRLARAPRFRQKLAGVPLGVHDPVWVDDPGFDPANHLLAADTDDLGALVDRVLSTPLRRDRPLWELWISDLALVGKMHHCMVDGAAVVELGNLLLDPRPDGSQAKSGRRWQPAAAPSAGRRLARAIADRAGDVAALALTPARSPSSLLTLPGTITHTLLPPAPSSPLNRPGSAGRHHIRVTRALDEVRAIRRRFGVTPNDVVLAVCAGALRRFLERRGEEPQRLKAMVPADVRSSADAAGGNRISFVFITLPCDEPDPVERLLAVNAATAQRARDDDAEHLDAAFGILARTPGPVQQALARGFAHPRLFNLTISSVAGPAVPRYLRGCRLREVHSAVPLAGSHALSIGVVTAAGHVGFGICADTATLPDADALAGDLDDAFGELL
jgi:diacylglycerol O-acyltransferase / wax synthase